MRSTTLPCPSITRATLLFVLALNAAPVSAQTVNATERTSVIGNITAALEKQYVFPDVALAMIQAVRGRQQRGEYDAISEARVFADSLTAHLRAVSRDLHLRVVARGTLPSGAPPQQPAPALRAVDGLEEAKILEGNLGYLRFSGFADVSRVGSHIESAMKELSSTDALIVDLRDNGGGSPSSVMYLAGYLFETKTLVARIYSRPDESTTEMWTADVPGPKYLGKDVYILTNRRTFSAAEAAAYHLQAFGRAKTVGDTTGGGAHRINSIPLGDRFLMSMPFTRPTNVRTGKDWEGVGVLPDIAVDPARALVVAQLAALRKLPTTPLRARAIAALEGSR